MSEKNNLAELGEFGLIELIKQQVSSSASLRMGIGDDCSIQPTAPDQDLLTSKDLLIEGVHFDLNWTGYEQLGRKSAAVNLSDIAAMGGRPRYLWLGLAVPAGLTVDNIQRFMNGFIAEASACGAVLAGGDTCRSPGPLMISVTVQGEVAKGRAVLRSGARSGDAVYVSGQLGESAFALTELQKGHDPVPEVAQRHHVPSARTGLGALLAEQGLATAMIDVSDGLLADLGHILKASSKGAEIVAAQVPVAPVIKDRCPVDEGLSLALSGGEDYELLFTADPLNTPALQQLSTELALPLSRIGTITVGSGLDLLGPNGTRVPVGLSGFDHFGEK
ncbi:MAG: thiamine-phosphate kinase [Desulfuromonas sp.]|nr:MAG: thiamine-phosphate kinase [Desulfuromonas sp.]